MNRNIMFIPAIVLMVVEIKVLTFLVWSWKDAKRQQKEKEERQ